MIERSNDERYPNGQTAIYLDNNATTRMDDRVLSAMLPFLSHEYGNPSSRTHAFGWKAEAAIELSRKRVTEFVRTSNTRNIVFTSGATESISLAIRGVAEMYASSKNHIITQCTEHPAVLETCLDLQKRGFELTILSVDSNGTISLEELLDSIRSTTCLVSIMAVNNEIGTIQPIDAIGDITSAHRVLFHSDATQAVGKIDVDVTRSKIDLLSFTGHKFHGPKGVGALVVNRDNPACRISPQVMGGGQEDGVRSGTHNVPGIVGLGVTCGIALEELSEFNKNVRRLRDLLWSELLCHEPSIELNGAQLTSNRVAGNLNCSVRGIEGTQIARNVVDVAFSTGSACHSSNADHVGVLANCGYSDERQKGALRFGLSKFTTQDEIQHAVSSIVNTLQTLRKDNNTNINTNYSKELQ